MYSLTEKLLASDILHKFFWFSPGSAGRKTVPLIFYPKFPILNHKYLYSAVPWMDILVVRFSDQSSLIIRHIHNFKRRQRK